ncbi:hypothetical protein PHYBLDRAFT_150294 [Phycomyces blakesleeanus NRRL 1555(-)]|uniref:Tc1-like transposase DDE domain-containing protein n=1 Tax=Phycomyces blakesleeanus (strain ATCC 8743b / DSM 1359 / FGSC 10004 / NBRC 33097 / NRRL 1555) TaxID=763407 RepID=A0A162NE29_PHYB8|nr:hypothetical protein PHYBLDRAFT_150294 [Phycomyces blakesleeanus NRRL 1555(-)]OAD68704.1 hypothetical protein PHYBLDRAFT_150294 [Phycomyces blakesleeanus NRRL 1555(-)]|eukprot:XP_018286744.1 hypothetical protein PHYBLDRAFT_150294 [Phycomyces blakesleeanus NRRL 1555(-)]
MNPNQTAIAKRRKRNKPQKVLLIHIKNMIVEKCHIEESFESDATVEPKKQGGSHIESLKIINECSKFIQDFLIKCCTLTLDEADFNANLIREQGWSKKGKASIVKTKLKRGLNISILAGISYQSVESVQAKLSPDGMIGPIFVEFVKMIMDLLDYSNSAPHNFIMNNVLIHRFYIVIELFANSQHHLHFSPPYSLLWWLKF